MTGWVSLPGRQTREQIRDLYRRADVFVAPADLESFGIAALEARSAGLPVLARAGSGIADFVRPGVDGWLVGSDQDLAGTLARILDDPAPLHAVAHHNRATAPPIHWPAVLATADALYEAAINRQTFPRFTYDTSPPR
jgi:glycosyltransferase involved in cell wall biosynthesis